MVGDVGEDGVGEFGELGGEAGWFGRGWGRGRFCCVRMGMREDDGAGTGGMRSVGVGVGRGVAAAAVVVVAGVTVGVPVGVGFWEASGLVGANCK